MIGIIDYGMGNLASVQNALNHLEVENKIISDPTALKNCEKLILPGVGAFRASMKNLHNSCMEEISCQLVKEEKKPLLGICLGMQVLFEAGQEDGYTPGFGFLKGQVIPMTDPSIRIPHIGWNQLEKAQDHPVFNNISDRPFVYFVHSYYASDMDSQDLLGYCHYGPYQIPGLVYHENVLGAQFHPEKSAEDGLKILKYFVEEFV